VLLNVDGWDLPIVLAPLAGGPSTPALAAAVSNAGGLGFLAGGYLTPDQLEARVEELAASTARPYGVNLFCPPPASGESAAIRAYCDALRPLAATAGVKLGAAHFDDDNYAAKVALLTRRPPAVVSFTFGCPDEATIERCKRAGARVWVTVTDVDEATTAVGQGADALVAQGAQAGGHRGSFLDDDDEPIPLLDLLGEIRAALPTAPVVATGGLMTGSDVAGAFAAGAAAAQLGTAFLRCPEAGTSDVHRRALLANTATVLTRAFTGRLARGIANAWTEGVGNQAPSAYPQLHHVTAALRAHGRAVGEPDLVNLWAGTGHASSRLLPAGDLVTALADELRAAR